jgi:coiled-coil domain-containing protein 40
VQVAAAEQQLRRIDQDMARTNTLIAKNEEQSELLSNATANLERNVLSELKDLEAQTTSVKLTIDRSTQDKKTMLDDILDTEQDIMNWERKLQLEKEMQIVLDPTVGQVMSNSPGRQQQRNMAWGTHCFCRLTRCSVDTPAHLQDVLGAMKKEIHRMELRKSELTRTKEQLITELEKSIDKRDTICVRGRANQIISKKGGKLTEKELNKKQAELNQSIRDTEAERAATDDRIKALDTERMSLAERMQDVAAQCLDLRQADIGMRKQVEHLTSEKQARDLQLMTLLTASSVLDGKVLDEEGSGLPTPELQVVEADLDTISSLIKTLQAQHAQPIDVLDNVHLLTSAVDVLG